MAHGDCRGSAGDQALVDVEPGQILLDRSIQTDSARFRQLHDSQAGKGFAGRTQDQRSLSSHGLASRGGYTKSLEMNDPVALHDANRDTWNVHRVHLRGDIG